MLTFGFFQITGKVGLAFDCIHLITNLTTVLDFGDPFNLTERR